MDYRNSHISPEKGPAYDKTFAEMAYRKFVWIWEQQVLFTILHNFFPQKPDHYLDFACGTGRIISYIEPYVNNSIGIDISDSMLKVARNKVKYSRLIKGDITKDDPLGGIEFDLVTAFRFFLNAQEALRKEAILKISQHLKNGGYFVFNIHMNRGCLLARISEFYCSIKRIPYNMNLMGIHETENLVALAGLEIIKMYHFGIIPIWDENAKLPYRLIKLVERGFSNSKYPGRFSRYLIFICQKV